MKEKWVFSAFWCVAALLLSSMAIGGGHLLPVKAYGNASPTSFGGYTVSAAGLNQYYVIGIEVPPGASQLVIDIFDADLGAGGAADISGDRDNQSGGAWDSYYLYILYDEQLNLVPVANYNYFYGSATLPAGSDNAWTTFYSTANPAPGHWVMVVYPYPSTAAGGGGASDDLNAFGVRAHDGDPGPGGVEFNTYMISPIPIGTNGIPGPTQSSARYQVYPYVTSGCQLNTHDFDSDVPNLPAGTPPLETQIQLANRTGAYSHTVTQATMSGQDTWVNNTIGPVAGVEPSGTDYFRDGMGIWNALLVVNEQGTGGATAGANYNEVIIANFNNPTPVPTNAIEADTFRWYLPTDAGGAPVKTYMTQRVNFWSGPNPPVVGQATEVEVEITVYNPTASPVTFSAANNDLVRSAIPAVPELAFVAGSVNVTQGTAPGVAGLAIPPAGGTGSLEWDPGIIAPGSSAQLSYRMTVTPSAAGQRIVVTGTPASVGTTADYVDHTGNPNSPFANVTFGPLCELAVTEAQPVPTPVYLSYVRLEGQPGNYHLRWHTAFEAGNVAFRVFDAREDSPEHRLAEVPVTKAGHLGEASYSVDLPVAHLQSVWIQDVALDGSTSWHGPFHLNQTFGVAGVERVRRASRSNPEIIDDFARRAQWQRQQRVPELDLMTNDAGVYRVSFDALSAQGYDFIGLSSDEVRLLQDGHGIPVIYNPEHTGIIQPGDYFEFIASERKTLYGTRNAYRLTAGRPLKGQDWESVPVSAMPTGSGDFAAWRRMDFEQQAAYSFSSPDADNDPWYWQSYLVRNTPLAASVPFSMDSVDAGQAYTLHVGLWTMTDWPGVVNDHHVKLAVNGVPVGDFLAAGQGQQNLLAHIPPGVLQSGENTLELTFPADTGVAYELNYLDDFGISGFFRASGRANAQLHYPRNTRHDSQPLVNDVILRHSFDNAQHHVCQIGPCATLTVDANTPVWAYQRSGDQLWRIQAVAEGAAQTLTVVPQSLVDTWVVFGDTRLSPDIQPAATGNVQLSANTDLLVIAPAAWVPTLQPWISAREKQGHVVSVVAAEDVYHHFSHGLMDGQALADFIAQASQVQPSLANVLLVGAGSYDYLDYLGSGQTAVLPGLYAPTGPYVRYAPVDAAMGDVDADGVPDIAIGRWPAQDITELQTLVNKTLAFEQKMSQKPAAEAVMLLDADDGSVRFSDLLAQQSPSVFPSMWNETIVDGNQPGAKQLFLQQLTSNPFLIEYLGHSSPTQWSASALLTSSDALALGNDGLAMWFQWGCWNNYAVSPTFVSLSEALLASDHRGAVLTLGATAIADASVELALRRHFLPLLMKGRTVGEALVEAKAAVLRESGKDAQHLQDVLAGITILGDPSLRLVY